MPDPIKIRAQVQGEIAEIRMLLQHPMETGLRKDEKGQIVPAHFIHTFTVVVNGRLLVEGQLNAAVAKNPLFAFRARGLKPGDRIAVRWLDSQGEQRNDETTVT